MLELEKMLGSSGQTLYSGGEKYVRVAFPNSKSIGMIEDNIPQVSFGCPVEFWEPSIHN